MIKSKNGLLDTGKLKTLFAEHSEAVKARERLLEVQAALTIEENGLLSSGRFDDKDTCAAVASVRNRRDLIPFAVSKADSRIAEIDSALTTEAKRVGALAATRAADKHGELVEKLITIMLPFWPGDRSTVTNIAGTAPAIRASGAGSAGWTMRLAGSDQMAAIEYAEGVKTAIERENEAVA
jgi:hypothetical protein